jgi:energy-converting hydrogenase Eha subunit A
MTDLEPGQIGLFVLVGILVLIVFSYMVSLIARIPLIRKEAQQNKPIRTTIVFTLGFLIFTTVFLAVTRLEADTSFETPPHGVASGIWDDFENMQSGAFFINDKTGDELVWDDMVLSYLGRERFLRYMRPPFMRQYCFTGHVIACKWADIDLVNYDNKQEWIDFFIRLIIGIASGLVTGFMAWVHTESKEVVQTVQAD